LFLDRRKGFVIRKKYSGEPYSSALLRTEDGGENWEEVEIYSNAGYFYDLTFIENKFGWLSTSKGEVFYTDEGGEIWRLISTIKGQHILSLFFHDRRNGWAGTSVTGLFRTTDGGNTWEYNAFSELHDINLISFIDKNRGFVSSDEVTYYKLDGGSQWNKLYEESWFDLEYIHDENIIIAGRNYPGRNLIIFNIKDLSYKNIIEHSGLINVNSIDFSDKYYGWAVGNYGYIAVHQTAEKTGKKKWTGVWGILTTYLF